MELLLETGTAVTAANIFVSLGKLGWPAMPSWALVLLALASGIGSTFLVSLGLGDVQTGPVIAANVLQGLFAAAGAAGVDRTNVSADQRSSEAQQGTR